jgi:hypothetical protein
MKRSITVPAGQYFLGDPFYAVPKDKWYVLLSSCDSFAEPLGKFDTHEVVAFKTKHNDGMYNDQCGNEYMFDSGLIGLTPMSATDKLDATLRRVGIIVAFPAPTLCVANDEVLLFGQYRINMTDDDE